MITVQIAYCHGVKCRRPVEPNEQRLCPCCGGELEFLTSAEEMARLGIQIPHLILVVAPNGGNNGHSLLIRNGDNDVPPDLLM